MSDTDRGAIVTEGEPVDYDILSKIDFGILTEKTGIEPYNINGELFYTVKQFAKLIKRSRIRVRELTNRGNENRVLRHMKIDTLTFIYAVELGEFPFSTQGNSGVTYLYRMNQRGDLQADVLP